jgi:formylglycine-generating enzyme required for sulfatase activity
MIGNGLSWVLPVVFLAPSPTSAAADPTDGRTAPIPMIRVPGGKFFFGRQPNEEFPGRPFGHEVTVSDFWIDKNEVTTGEYLDCERAKACPMASRRFRICNASKAAKRRQHPINCVTAIAAEAFCRWKGKRLPSAEEWERAARGDDGRIFPWGNSDPKDQLCRRPDDDLSQSTCPVGSFPKGASPYGVLDMAGNVAEWTSTTSWYAKKGDNKCRIIKGGSYEYDEMELADDMLSQRSDESGMYWTTMDLPTIGFRCARDIDSAETKSAAASNKPSPAPTQEPAAMTPPRGSRERKELLDAVRARLHVDSEFEVDRLTVAGTWAYFEGREHRSGGAQVAALLQRAPTGQWNVVDGMGLAGKSEGFSDFRKRITDASSKRQLPESLFR